MKKIFNFLAVLFAALMNQGGFLTLKADRGKGLNSQGLYDVQQRLVAQAFGVTLEEMIDKDMMMEVPNREGDIKVSSRSDIKQSFKIMEMNEQIKQTMLTSSGTQEFMLNDAAAAYFGASTGVFNPAVYATMLEGNAINSLIPKLWGLQPFAANDLSTKLIYFVKTDPFDGSGVPTFARTAEGRAGSDIGFEVKAESVDAQRYIVHLPYSVELQKILQGRLGLDAKVMEAFTEAATYRDEYWSFHKWYLAMTAGTLEGSAFALYRDGVIADVDGIPSCYTAYYNLTNGAIKCGDATSYGGATQQTASGADIFDLIMYVQQTMAGTATAASEQRGYRYCWNPDFVAVPQKIANKLITDYKDGTLDTVWVAKNDIPMYKDENNFLCRLALGNKSIDVWVIPDVILSHLPAATYVTTDSPTKTISPMYFGRYTGMGAIAPASPLLFFVDDGYEVIGNPGTLRRNMTKVHTMFKLGSEMLMNASMSFVVKVVEVS